AMLGERAAQLHLQHAVKRAANRVHLHAGADVAVTGAQGLVRALHGGLPAVARRVHVSDVVPGNIQAALGGIQAGQGNTEQIATHSSPPAPMLRNSELPATRWILSA